MKTFSQLQTDLSNPSRERRRGFALAQDICQFVSGNESEGEVHEVVLRALEHRSSFGAASMVIEGLAREIGLFPYLDPSACHLPT